MSSATAETGPGPSGVTSGRLLLNRGVLGTATLLGAGAAWTGPAQAHVKWFAPYIVEAAPRPVAETLTNPWFWSAIALVLVFFLATRVVEASRAGDAVLSAMDKVTDPLWRRLDDFVRVTIGAFFVAIFAVGGVYLTPDLKTPSEWVSWTQLLIAAGVFSRKTMPFSAAGIIALWVLALRDYDLFHLLDYLALGVGVAAYLVLESSNNPEWRKHRFEALRWAVAIALMWSSLEKFAYPNWFYPLVEEKPFLTFGIPRDIFIPMAGVAEFTLGFGLIWTPLVRRLSAISLFVIFNAAVYPFGRIDLVGHALIMAIIVVIAADHTREIHFIPAVRRAFAGVPAGLAGALVLFSVSYWGLHTAFYGPNGQVERGAGEMATHSHSPEHPHGPQAPGGIGAPPNKATKVPAGTQSHSSQAQGRHEAHATAQPMPNGEAAKELAEADAAMMRAMNVPYTGDADVDFRTHMIPHHQGGIEMAKIILKYAKDPETKILAKQIIGLQEKEITQMRGWLERNSKD